MEGQARLLPAHHVTEFIPHHLDDLMTRRQALQHFLSDGFDANSFNEVLDDLEIHIGFEQRQADLLQGLADVLLRKHTLPTKLLEDLLELIAQRVQHRAPKKKAIEVLPKFSDRLVKSRERASGSV